MKYTVEQLREWFNASWSAATAHPDYQKEWSEDKPYIGQCCVTALVVQDLIGGLIYKNRHRHHFWNSWGFEEIDLTKDQFEPGITIKADMNMPDRQKLLANKELRARYELLRDRVFRLVPMEVYHIKMFGGMLTVETWDQVITSVEEADLSIGDEITIKKVTMNREEFESLPEFDGF